MQLIAAFLVVACVAAAADVELAVSGSGEICEAMTDYKIGVLQRVQFPVKDEFRSLLLYIPSSLPSTGARVPAVLAFHGFHSNPWYFGRLIDITTYAERYSYIVGLPFGTSPTFNSDLCCPAGCDEECCAKGDRLDILRPCMWNVGSMTKRVPRVGHTDDVAMARAAADFLVGTLCVDRLRVSAMGFSMGGMMMHRLFCDAADVFNGIASISGSMDVPPPMCNPARPTAWIQYCGTADKGCTKTVNSTFHLFAERNGCTSSPQASYTSASTHCATQLTCTGGAFVEMCLLEGLGDEVPGHQRQVPVFVPQPATNIDAIKYSLDRFSTQLAANVPAFASSLQAMPSAGLAASEAPMPLHV